MKKPKIRFKGFQGEWETSPLSQIATMHARIGWQNLRKDEFLSKGDYYLITGTDFVDGIIDYQTCHYVTEDRYNQDKNIQLKEGSILITKDGTLGKVAYVESLDKPATLNAGVFNVVCKKGNTDSRFLFQYLKSPRLMNHVNSTATGGTIKHLNQNILVNFPICLPEKKEQEFIASYFHHLDALIQSTTKKIESLKQVKAASLQSMFPQEGETTPRVRFKGFEGEWEKVQLNSFAKRVTRKNSHLESTLALTIASAHGLVSQIDYFNNLVVGSNISNYYLLKKGEFAYNKSYSNGYPFGSVKRLDKYEQGILSTLYITFCIDDSISSDYLTHYFDTTLWHRDVAENAAEGARNHGLLNIGAEDFLKIKIVKPQSIAEQRAIASYFTTLDRQITLQTQRLEKLKQIKEACLDNMFV